ncbi:MAG: hypothetical protein MHM6MM_007166 [Cercozoa sp. M6MM]
MQSTRSPTCYGPARRVPHIEMEDGPFRPRAKATRPRSRNSSSSTSITTTQSTSIEPRWSDTESHASLFTASDGVGEIGALLLPELEHTRQHPDRSDPQPAVLSSRDRSLKSEGSCKWQDRDADRSPLRKRARSSFETPLAGFQSAGAATENEGSATNRRSGRSELSFPPLLKTEAEVETTSLASTSFRPRTDPRPRCAARRSPARTRHLRRTPGDASDRFVTVSLCNARDNCIMEDRYDAGCERADAAFGDLASLSPKLLSDPEDEGEENDENVELRVFDAMLHAEVLDAPISDTAEVVDALQREQDTSFISLRSALRRAGSDSNSISSSSTDSSDSRQQRGMLLPVFPPLPEDAEITASLSQQRKHSRAWQTVSHAPRVFSSPARTPQTDGKCGRRRMRSRTPGASRWNSLCGNSLSLTRRRLFSAVGVPRRFLPSKPRKVLDAPRMSGDYYRQLLHWSCRDRLGVALGSEVFLWHAPTRAASKLCDINQLDLGGRRRREVTSLQFDRDGTHCAIGTSDGLVALMDVERKQLLQWHQAHDYSRVGAMHWVHGTGTQMSRGVLASAGRDSAIVLQDWRSGPNHRVVQTLRFHSQEVCGLAWSPDDCQLASGSNDNTVAVWDARGVLPLPELVLREHEGAVKALAWAPCEPRLLATGGGSADRSIRFWNTSAGSLRQRVHVPVHQQVGAQLGPATSVSVTEARSLRVIDTGAQVCNLLWPATREGRELISTHGFSDFSVTVRQLPSARRLAELRGHTNRVLFAALSPDGRSLATASCDETLRIWSLDDEHVLHSSSPSALKDEDSDEEEDTASAAANDGNEDAHEQRQHFPGDPSAYRRAERRAESFRASLRSSLR